MPSRFFFPLQLSFVATMHHGIANAFELLAGGSLSLTVAGAYFPAWLACSLVGVFVAIIAHALRVAARLTPSPPLQLMVCLSIGSVAGALVWFAWVGL